MMPWRWWLDGSGRVVLAIGERKADLRTDLTLLADVECSKVTVHRDQEHEDTVLWSCPYERTPTMD